MTTIKNYSNKRGKNQTKDEGYDRERVKMYLLKENETVKIIFDEARPISGRLTKIRWFRNEPKLTWIDCSCLEQSIHVSLSQNEFVILEIDRLGFSDFLDLKLEEFGWNFGKIGGKMMIRRMWGVHGVNLGKFWDCPQPWGDFRWRKRWWTRKGEYGWSLRVSWGMGVFRIVIREYDVEFWTARSRGSMVGIECDQNRVVLVFWWRGPNF